MLHSQGLQANQFEPLHPHSTDKSPNPLTFPKLEQLQSLVLHLDSYRSSQHALRDCPQNQMVEYHCECCSRRSKRPSENLESLREPQMKIRVHSLPMQLRYSLFPFRAFLYTLPLEVDQLK